LFRHISRDLDARKICGFPSMYTMLCALKKAKITSHGKLIDYRQAIDRSQECMVTFASAYWYRGNVR
jgi:hypothetical protein